MDKIKFITGNVNKFLEVSALIDGIEQLDINLPEIQEIDPHKIIKAKLDAAFEHHSGEFIVEDTSLYLECLNGFPGPLIKWFKGSIGNEGIVNLVNKLQNSKATAKTILGYAKSPDEVTFFEGLIEGEIVNQAGNEAFGWDPIFKPNGHTQTFAEMSKEEKNLISHRAQAVNKLRDYLQNREA